MVKLNYFLFIYIFLFSFKFSSEQIIIPMNEEGPTIVTRQTFTVQGDGGSPIRVTRIQFHSKNLNAGGGSQATPLDLMRLRDERISSIFEEIISQRVGLRIILNELNNGQNNENEEEKEEVNHNENKKNDNEDKNKEENKDNIDDKEFELDESDKEEKDDKTIEQDKEQNKTEANKDKTNESKDNKNKKVHRNKKEKKEKNVDDKKKTIGKLKVNPDILKPKKIKNKLSQKEIIFSRICKYIFYSIILFTIYILVRKLLELLEIIDPETQPEMKDAKIENNKNEKDKEAQRKENEIILNRKKEENKLN